MFGLNKARGAVALSLVTISLALAGCVERAREPDVVLDQIEYETRRDRIINFVEERRARLDIIATTTTRSGQVIDWIKLESQSPTGEIANPPEDDVRDAPAAGIRERNPYLDTELPRALRALKLDEGRAQTELQIYDEAIGPPGTVPIVRFDLDNYFRLVKELPENPADIIAKVPPPAPASNDRYYAVWRRYGDVFGSAGRINIWNTNGPVSNETSIAQVAVIRGTPMQAIEAGKVETAGFSPSKRPVFFTYYRTNGAASGDWVGGWNALVDGWVQYSPTVAPGMSLVPWESQSNGPQYSVDVVVRLWEGNWWVKAAGEWAGYYPYCKGADASPCDDRPLFSTAGIRDKAYRLDWYGEVFDESAPAATSTDMGSGAFANQRWRRAAYFRNLTFFWQPNTYWWWDSGSISVTDAQCYSGDGPYYSSDPNWRNWYYYGGPGKEAAGCS